MSQSESKPLRAWVGFGLIWLGPVCAIATGFTLAARRLAIGQGLFLATLVFLCLSPIGARLTKDSALSSESSVRRRRSRLEVNAPTHVSDVVWTVLTFLCLVWFCATATALVRIVTNGGLDLNEFTVANEWWVYLMLALIVLMKLLFGVLSMLLPWTMLAGCWRRTKWGSDLASFEAAEQAAMNPVRMPSHRSQVAMLVVATVALFAVGASLIFQVL
jgi:hypothetical protein